MRFANHSCHPNIEPRVMYVQGEHRIGMYATQDIEAQVSPSLLPCLFECPPQQTVNRVL